MGGDFNAVPDLAMDSTTRAHRMGTSLQGSIHRAEVFDVWRCLHAGERDFTFFSAPHRTYTRIDLFLTDYNTLTRAVSASINDIT